MAKHKKIIDFESMNKEWKFMLEEYKNGKEWEFFNKCFFDMMTQKREEFVKLAPHPKDKKKSSQKMKP